MSNEAFPDVRWGHDPGPRLRRAITWAAGRKPISWCISRLAPLDRRLLANSGGRLTILGPIGAPLLLLTTIGRQSGQRRQTPLLYLREGDRIFLVGSNFGQSAHPAWSSNLLAHPDAWVTMGGKQIPVTATPVTGSDHDRIFNKFVDYGDNYAAYRDRTNRHLRVFALTRR